MPPQNVLLTATEEAVGFKPSGLNDERRVDLTDKIFIAVDRFSVNEVDDAVYAEVTSDGTYHTLVAIADGGQIPADSAIAEVAKRVGRTNYSRKNPHTGVTQVTKRMLPQTVIGQLELRGPGPHRALIVSNEYTPQGNAVPGALDIFPGLVRVENYDHESLVDKFLAGHEHPLDTPLVSFVKTLLAVRNIQLEPPLAFGGRASSKGFGHQIVKNYMARTNMDIPAMADTHGIRILTRSRLGRTAAAQVGLGFGEQKQKIGYTVGVTHLHPGIEESDGPVRYAQGTSPLWRAADLCGVHHQISYALAGKEPPLNRKELRELGRLLTRPVSRP